MSSVSIIYSRSRSIASQLIRIASGFGWSHASILDGDHVIEALMFKGVVRTPLSEFKARVRAYAVVDVECQKPHSAIDFARKQIGKGYDWRAILGHIFQRQTHSRRRWHCVELIESALIAGGRERFRRQPFRLTPQQSFLVR